MVFLHYFNDILFNAGMYLEKEGVLQISDGAIQHQFVSAESNWSPDIIRIAEQIIIDNSKIFFDKVDTSFEDGIMHINPNAKLTSNEARDAIENTIIEHSLYSVFGHSLKESFNHSQVYNALELCTALIADMLDHLGDGENVLSNSLLVNKILSNHLNSNNKYQQDAIKKYSAFNAMQILLPYIRDANFEDILDIRLYAKDELIEMRNYIDDCIKELQLEGVSVIDTTHTKEKIDRKIIPAIHGFERKIESMKVSSVQQFVKNLANPFYYSPLITSFFADIPPAILLAMSLGLIGLESIANYYIKKNDIKNEPLYFTVALKKY